MTPLPAVPNVLRVAQEGTVSGEAWAMITHWQFATTAGDLSSANVNAICAKIVNSYRDNIDPLISSACIQAAVTAVDLTSITGATGTAADGTPGGTAAVPISPEACFLIHKTISRRYRGGHPRQYFPGIQSASTTGGLGVTIDASVHALFVSHTNAFYDDIPPAVTTDADCNCSAFEEVCVHYVSGGARLAVPLVDPIVGHTLENQLATQRRRLHRH